MHLLMQQLIDPALPVQRKMVRILRDQDMRQQTRSCQPARNRPTWGWSLHDPFATLAAQLGPHMTNHLKTRRHVLQYLGNIFAQLAQHSPAVGTSGMFWHMRPGLPW